MSTSNVRQEDQVDANNSAWLICPRYRCWSYRLGLRSSFTGLAFVMLTVHLMISPRTLAARMSRMRSALDGRPTPRCILSTIFFSSGFGSYSPIASPRLVLLVLLRLGSPSAHLGRPPGHRLPLRRPPVRSALGSCRSDTAGIL